MSWWSRLWRNESKRDLDRELQFHIAERISALKISGLTEEEARRQVRQEFGGIEQVKEDCRDARGARWLEETVNDIRFAIRTLRKAPIFTITVVAALAFCIGANTAIFSVVDTVLFHPLPFPDQERLVSVSEGVPSLGFPILPFSPPDYLFVAAENRSFTATGIYHTQSYEISGVGQPRRVYGARVTSSLFRVLGVFPVIGRVFTQEEDEHAKESSC